MTIEENSKQNHPEGLEEGLRQSAAGEVVDLGSFEQYIPLEDRKPGEIFELSDEDRGHWANGWNYDLFTVEVYEGENYAVPVRPGIIATYTELDLGYLIQQTENGFRYISVEAGEQDLFGNFYASKKAALQAAVTDWRENGQGDSWAAWSKQMAKDSQTSDTADAELIASVLIEEIGGDHTATELQELASKIAARLNG